MTEKKPTLLVVDDTAANIDILLDALGADYAVRVATDGNAALSSVKKFPPDLILLDIMMPGMDGFEVCRRLKVDPATQDIPIIFITAMNEDADEARGLSLGAVDYITKPFHAAIVNARVRNHLELKKHRDHLAALVAERTRELVKAYERVRELGRIKDDFLRMISYEIRIPANGVLGIGDLMTDMLPASDDATLYRDLFQKSSVRLQRLIDDASMITAIENVPTKNGAAISFFVLLGEVRASLQDENITLLEQDVPETVSLQGDRALLTRALKTLILLAISFCREKHIAIIAGEVETRGVRLHLELDDMPLSAEEAEGFFEIGSSARSASNAEAMGLSPVVASKIISAFGGEIKLVKGAGETGYLDVLLITENTKI